MADIKVRELSRGTIKAMNHAAAASHRMKGSFKIRWKNAPDTRHSIYAVF